MTDIERLDWLEALARDDDDFDLFFGDDGTCILQCARGTWQSDTLRGAVDQGMREFQYPKGTNT